MADNKIKAVLFDLGETIINFGKLDVTDIFRKAGRASYDFLKENDQPVPSYKRYLWTNLIAIRFHSIISAITGNDFDSLDALKKYGRRNGFKLTDEQWHHINWCWYKPLRDKATVEPDIRQTLTKLQQAGIKLGVISNTFVNASALDRHLQEEGIIDFFPMRIYSYQLPKRKPHKSIFITGANRIDTPPENIIYVGDRIDFDVKGSQKANMFPVLKSAYTNENKKVPQGIMKIDYISQLPDIISEINS